MPFVWGYKPHHISKTRIQKSKKLGGLSLSVVQHKGKISQTSELVDTPKWLHLDSHAAKKQFSFSSSVFHY